MPVARRRRLTTSGSFSADCRQAHQCRRRPLSKEAARPKCHIDNLSLFGYRYSDTVRGTAMAEKNEESTLLPMLIAGLVLIVIGAIVVMTFV